MAAAYGKDVSSAQEGVMNEARFSLRAVGSVESPLTDRDQAPRQGDEGAPPAWLVLDPGMRAAIDGTRIAVLNLEALDQTPILDIKPALGPVDQR